MSENKNQEEDEYVSGFSEKHEARRYRQIDPVVNKMGGWANFRVWIQRHGEEYFNTCLNLKNKETQLIQELADTKYKLHVLESKYNQRKLDLEECRNSESKLNAEVQRLKAQLVKARELFRDPLELEFSKAALELIMQGYDKVIEDIGSGVGSEQR